MVAEKKEKNKITQLIIVGLIVFASSIFAFTGFAEQTILGLSMQYHMTSNDLSIYFGDENNFEYSVLSPKEKYDYLYVNKSVEQFSKIISQNYEYSLDEKDCKYWAYIWFMWYIENKDNFEEGLNHKFLTTNNHIHNYFYTPNKYCVADGFLLECTRISSE